MSIWVIMIAVLAGWAIGPVALQLLGAGLALMTLALLAAGQPLGPVSAVMLGGGGALMLYIGLQWKVARVTGYPTAVGVKVRQSAARLVLKPNPHSAQRRWLASQIARALGPIQADGLVRDAEAQHLANGPSSSRWQTLKARGPRTGATRSRGRTGPRPYARARPSNEPFDDRPSSAAADSIEGTAHHTKTPPPSATEGEAAARQRLREEVDGVLEEVRDCLERIIWALFVNQYEAWPRRLSQHRRQRRGDLPPIDPGEGSLHDRRLLFSVIAYDWTLIGSDFKRDPSPAARRLCTIANRYAHEGPLGTDPADARQAFTEILDALRPQAINTAKGFMKHSRPLAHL